GWRRWGGGVDEGTSGDAAGHSKRAVAGGESEGGTAAVAVPRGETVAVVGVARPDAFVANVRAAGTTVSAELRFADHHDYTARDVERIRRRLDGRPVVTTEKDAIKLDRLAADLELWVLEQEVRVEAGADVLERWMDALVG
ncbi:MAG: tetraacyldisaccharide 4'-kinase, partial [Gemmatimonadota bacterium]